MRAGIIPVILSLSILSCSNPEQSTGIEGTGTIEAVQVDISASVAGQIIQIGIEEGDVVSEGDTLCMIDDVDYVIQRKQAQAGLDAAAANYDLLKAGARKEDIQRARENMNAAKAVLEKAKTNFERMKNLLASGSATQSRYDEVKAGYDIAQANYQASRNILEKLETGARPQEIEIARSNKALAEANLELVEKKISDCRVVSPVGGLVTGKYVDRGERIRPGGMIATVTNSDSMWITIYVGDKYIGNVTVGQSAEISIDSFPDKVFHGVVGFIAEEAEFTPKNIQTKDERQKLVFGVKILINNDEGILKAGLPADAVILRNNK